MLCALSTGGARKGRVLGLGVSAGIRFKVVTIVSVTSRSQGNGTMAAPRVTGQRGVSGGCLRRVLSSLDSTKLIQNRGNSGNNCIVTGNLGRVAFGSVVGTLSTGILDGICFGAQNSSSIVVELVSGDL